MSVLMAYASRHGATEGIAQAIADRLVERGLEAAAGRVEEVKDLRGVDSVVLGSAIYAGSWLKEATAFVDRYEDALSALPIWLFSSGPLGSEVQDHEEQPRQLGDVADRLHPRGHRVFFGALHRDQLGFAERMMVKAVRAPEGDFRDWDAIRAWADEIADALATASA